VPPAVKQQLAAGKELAVTLVPVDLMTGRPPKAIQYRFRKMTPAFHRQISAKRAQAVRDAIAKAVGQKNAARIRFAVSGVGDADLKHAAPKTDAQHVENRRVIITTRPGP
jgi:hypothetical protein